MKPQAKHLAPAHAGQATGGPQTCLTPAPLNLEALMSTDVDLGHPDMQRRVRAQKIWEFLDESSSTFYARMNPREESYDPLFPKPHRTSSTGKGPKRWKLGALIAWLRICETATTANFEE